MFVWLVVELFELRFIFDSFDFFYFDHLTVFGPFFFRLFFNQWLWPCHMKEPFKYIHVYKCVMRCHEICWGWEIAGSYLRWRLWQSFKKGDLCSGWGPSIQTLPFHADVDSCHFMSQRHCCKYDNPLEHFGTNDGSGTQSFGILWKRIPYHQGLSLPLWERMCICIVHAALTPVQMKVAWDFLRLAAAEVQAWLWVDWSAQ